MAAQDPGTFENWITDRIAFRTGTPASGNTGDFEKWITVRIYWHDYVEADAGSASASVSPSVSPSPSPGGSGEVVWGHDTGVLEPNVRNFQGNWTGTGQIFNPGVADIEYVRLQAGELMISEIWDTGDQIVELLQNVYSVGDDVDIDYRHGATPAACAVAAWNNYVGLFQSLGYVQIRITSTL